MLHGLFLDDSSLLTEGISYGLELSIVMLVGIQWDRSEECDGHPGKEEEENTKH